MPRLVPVVLASSLLLLTPQVRASSDPPTATGAAQAASTTLEQGLYRFDPVRLEGHPDVLDATQKQVLIEAVEQELPAALTRRYPQARVASGEELPTVEVTPVVVIPAALSLFESVEVRLELRVTGEAPRIVSQRFGLAALWAAQAEAHRVALDAVFSSLP